MHSFEIVWSPDQHLERQDLGGNCILGWETPPNYFLAFFPPKEVFSVGPYVVEIFHLLF